LSTKYRQIGFKCLNFVEKTPWKKWRREWYCFEYWFKTYLL